MSGIAIVIVKLAEVVKVALVKHLCVGMRTGRLPIRRRGGGAHSGVGGVSTVHTVLASSRGDIGLNLDMEIRPGQRGLRDARDVHET